jgi:hypothetical protein
MKFRLNKVSENRSVTKFRIMNEAGDVIGSASVPTNQADDLLRHWAGPTDQSATRGVARAAAKPGMAAALLRSRRQVSKAAILRGSN